MDGGVAMIWTWTDGCPRYVDEGTPIGGKGLICLKFHLQGERDPALQRSIVRRVATCNTTVGDVIAGREVHESVREAPLRVVCRHRQPTTTLGRWRAETRFDRWLRLRG